MPRLAKFFAIGFATGLILFFAVTLVLGVPLWWIIGGLIPLNTMQPAKLVITISPEKSLWSSGDIISVTVLNSSSQLAVQDATVYVMKDNAKIIYHTDSNGQTSFEYLGEPTIILVEKEGFDSVHTVIPRLPDIWIRELAVGLGVGVVGGLVSSITTKLLSDRKMESPKVKQKRRQKKKHPVNN